MSNVLIGIIGVILFIGLALAGALILGDDFRTANSSSRAAAVSGTMQQVAQAASMYQLKTGQIVYPTLGNYEGAFLAPRFLKAAPRNPYSQTPVYLVDSGGGLSGPMAYSFTDLGSDATAKAVCRAIEEGAGAANPDASQVVGAMSAAGGWGAWTGANKRFGCLLNTDYAPARYQAYIPI